MYGHRYTRLRSLPISCSIAVPPPHHDHHHKHHQPQVLASTPLRTQAWAPWVPGGMSCTYSPPPAYPSPAHRDGMSTLGTWGDEITPPHSLTHSSPPLPPQGMSTLGTWGDELTLRAAADSYGAVVRCVSSTAGSWYIRCVGARGRYNGCGTSGTEPWCAAYPRQREAGTSGADGGGGGGSTSRRGNTTYIHEAVQSVSTYACMPLPAGHAPTLLFHPPAAQLRAKGEAGASRAVCRVHRTLPLQRTPVS